MTALVCMGRERQVEEAMAPEIDCRWDEMVEAGTWAE
jgi:hypothetical protein